jgi:hypothetical protein
MGTVQKRHATSSMDRGNTSESYDTWDPNRVQQPSSLETPSRQSKLSTLLRIGLAWFQLQSGITQPILECPNVTLPYLEWMVPFPPPVSLLIKPKSM